MTEKKIVLVTGANGPLGKTLVEGFFSQNYFVIATDKESSSMHVGSSCFKYVKHDFSTDPMSSLLGILRGYDRIDCIINNASLTGASKKTGWATEFKNQTVEAALEAFLVNTVSPVLLVRDTESLWSKSMSPAVVNIGSIYGQVAPNFAHYEQTDMRFPAFYSATKAGISNMTKFLASYYSPVLRVNTVSPGGIFRNQPPEFVQRYNKTVPLNRMATELELSKIVYFLCSEAATYINGQDIVVDGGKLSWS